MNNNFSRETILAGNEAKKRIESVDASYPRFNGEANIETGSDGLDYTTPPQRMAGVRGAFAMKLMNDPNPVMDWNFKNTQNNLGYEFNQAKMMQGFPIV